MVGPKCWLELRSPIFSHIAADPPQSQMIHETILEESICGIKNILITKVWNASGVNCWRKTAVK